MAAILIFKCTEGAGVEDYSFIILVSSQTLPRPLSRLDTLPQVRLGTFEIKMATINGKTRSISTISRKNRGLRPFVSLRMFMCIVGSENMLLFLYIS